MEKFLLPLFVVLFTFCSSVLLGQDLGQLKNQDVNTLSANQIDTYWAQIKKGGYTMAQVEVLGKAQGISVTKIADFKRRVNSLGAIKAAENKMIEAEAKLEVANEAFGMKDGQLVKKSTSNTMLFGYAVVSSIILNRICKKEINY